MAPELAAEETEVVSASDVVDALNHFHDLVERNAAKPERIKSLLVRFADYVVWQQIGKGEGRLEVALFADAVKLAKEVTYVAEGHSPEPRFAGESAEVDLKGFEPSTS